MNFKDEITERERQVLYKICEQKTSKQIAYEMGVNVRTIEGCRSDIMFKLGTKSMVGLAIHAIQNKIYEI